MVFLLPHFPQTFGYARAQDVAKYFNLLGVKFSSIQVHAIHMFLNHFCLTHQDILKGLLRSRKMSEAHGSFLGFFLLKLKIED